MKILNKIPVVTVLAVSLMLGLTGPIVAFAAGPAPVNLLSAGSFAILSKAGITNTGSHTSYVTGNVGSSPITAAAIDIYCSGITGTIYGVDAAYVGSGNQTCFAGNPPLSNKTLVDNAVLDMETAYADAAGRTNPTATELGAGNIGGMTLAPGLYKWSTGVTIPTSVTLSGSANDVWIFQMSGDLNVASLGDTASGVKVILSGGAQASNIFWQVGGPTGATLGTYSTFNGTILSAKQVIIQTGAILYGRALAQTQVTLDASIVSVPTVSVSATPATPAVPTVTPATPATSATPATVTTDTGCLPGNKFSITTGNTCGSYVTTTDTGCLPGNKFSITTGNVCNSAAAFGQQIRDITTDLRTGSKGSAVLILQQFLISQNRGPAAQALARNGATTYFGPLTRAALAEFQAKVGISPALGNFGRITRDYLRANY